MTTGLEIIQRFETYCPLSFAEKGDKVGLQIGTLDRPVKKVLITLDIRPEVVQEAIDKQVDLIIAKHPIIFKSVDTITTGHPQSEMYLSLIQANISVYIAHTNIDIIPDGLNDWLCQRLEIENTTYLHKTHELYFQHIQTPVASFLEEDSIQDLKDLGAEEIQHLITREGILFTCRCLEDQRSAILSYLNEYQLYQGQFEITPLSYPKLEFGLGRVGQLKTPISLKELLSKIDQHLETREIRYVASDLDKKVSTIAICGGSGEKFYPDALNKGADVYITGDVYYHTAHDLWSLGLITIDPGHYIEAIFKEELVQKFNLWKEKEHWDTDFIISEIDTNPFFTFNKDK